MTIWHPLDIYTQSFFEHVGFEGEPTDALSEQSKEELVEVEIRSAMNNLDITPLKERNKSLSHLEVEGIVIEDLDIKTEVKNIREAVESLNLESENPLIVKEGGIDLREVRGKKKVSFFNTLLKEDEDIYHLLATREMDRA